MRVAKTMLHRWEEPYIGGTQGTAAVFFGGCALGCVFCQNRAISRGSAGIPTDPDELSRRVIDLRDQGARTLSLITPSHWLNPIRDWLCRLRISDAWRRRPLPVVWNSSGYERAAALRRLEGLVDVWLPDFKFASPDVAAEMAGAADYADIAAAALREMIRQQPVALWAEDGILSRGVAVRHLILPGQWRDSIAVLDILAGLLPKDAPVALMRQYTPQAGATGDLGRRLTTWEYCRVMDHARSLRMDSIWEQGRDSADPAYTPDFSERLRPERTPGRI